MNSETINKYGQGQGQGQGQGHGHGHGHAHGHGRGTNSSFTMCIKHLHRVKTQIQYIPDKLRLPSTGG